ncbi:Hypothetical predicted protein [Paramuricea clavata]|uniref:Uncharacterized protein n=1 Tax=Paramuricea clavata TaxID=317549 RepID=A0A6S7IEZ4_PARCT|nr:Hypothetical predicted protein [Paramuricea clavata]
MNPHFCEAVDNMTSISSKASDVDNTFDSTDSENHFNPESSDESNSLSESDSLSRALSDKKRYKSAGKKRTLSTSSQGQSAGESETNTDKSEKKSPTKKTKIRVHPKKLFSKPRSQSEATVQVAKSIESSTKEQEKNRDEQLKILLEAERKRDELFYAHQREQAEANRRHEMLLAQLLTRGSSTSYQTTGPKSSSDGPLFQYSLSYGYSLAAT